MALHLIKLDNGTMLSASHSSAPHGHVSISNEWILSSQSKDSLITLWKIGEKKIHQKFRLDESIGPLLISQSGDLCFAGGVNGTILCWEVSSGRLVCSWSGHSKGVRCLRSTSDASYLVTGGEDGVVSLWAMMDIEQMTNGEGCKTICERHSFVDHSQAVTDMFVSGGGVRGRIFTTSLDRTARIFEILSRQLLRTISFDTYLTSIAISTDEKHMFLGGAGGDIMVVNLWNGPQSSDNIVQSQESGEHLTLAGHSATVTNILMNEHDSQIISSSEDGSIKVWDVASRQCIQTMALNTPVNGLCTLLPLKKTVNQQDLIQVGAFKRNSVDAVGPTAGYVSFKRMCAHREDLKA
jgi:pre-rRNA-processing protein IPI3